MSDGYKPRAGSVPEKVIEYLAANPTRQLSKDDIAKKFGIEAVSVSTVMRKAATAGLVSVEKQGNAYLYGAPEPAEAVEPGDGKLLIATYSDGDVIINGHQANEDGSITLTREQLQQLIAHVTTPHLPPTLEIFPRHASYAALLPAGTATVER